MDDELTRSEERGRAPVVGVQGLTGGVGASCLTAALAVRASMAGRRALAVDSRPWAAGLDLLLGLDLEPGLRWPDLAGLEGAPDADALLSELPGEEGRSVLSWGRMPQRRGPARPWSVMGALAPAADLVVCDLPPPGAPEAQDWWLACDRVVLLAGDGLDAFAAAGATADLVSRAVAVVVRSSGGPVDPEAVSVALGLPLVARLRTDRQVSSAVVRGEPVGRSGPLARCADEVLAELVVPAGAGIAG